MMHVYDDRVATTVAVKEDSKETTTPDALGLIGNVAIVQHEGILQTRYLSVVAVKFARFRSAPILWPTV